MICLLCNVEGDEVFFDEKDNVCHICGYVFMKKERIPTNDNHQMGYAGNFHLQNLVSAEHISICPGQTLWKSLYEQGIYGEICTTYKYPHQYKEESPCLYDF